ncbi:MULTISPECIES: septum formation initiator family protein [unclassified Polaromonas]|jgi:cell division protein FtsB|uniref:septum formation initiator family protein n=1 Tax=unclassified Polaromonas TaxID=2638319 RepID=UPI0018CA1A6F|nr:MULTISPECIES: septum formation initiator family protein [unclassified Polaromonas]MBG6071221.1 cell division protein FtsB [Polaromonas sp. CG_9.7]MBG6113221.1 cell division protein FtsB [Polaromonas sp. CG_9.2]MDH6185753.1 cell division protein FtsB [Polaromonas sp. CG_23.6]
MGKRLLVPAVLVLLLGLFQAQLWMGRGSIPSVREMQQRLEDQLENNKLRQAANEQLGTEIKDLQEGLGMVEEKARSELGMVKPNEMFVQLTE